MITTSETRADRVARLLMEKYDNGEIEYADTYGEPGYTDPEKGILSANWNHVGTQALQDCLEAGGYALEWSDEWYIDYETCPAKAWRTEPDCYGWVCQVKYCDGYVLTPDSDITDWIDECKSTDWNQPHSCVPDWIDEDMLTEQGYTRWVFDRDEGEYHSGFHGRSDKPEEIYKRIEHDHGANLESVIFRLDSAEQFECEFHAFYRLNTWEETE
jgi:hypothetical protein